MITNYGTSTPMNGLPTDKYKKHPSWTYINTTNELLFCFVVLIKMQHLMMLHAFIFLLSEYFIEKVRKRHHTTVSKAPTKD